MWNTPDKTFQPAQKYANFFIVAVCHRSRIVWFFVTTNSWGFGHKCYDDQTRQGQNNGNGNDEKCPQSFKFLVRPLKGRWWWTLLHDCHSSKDHSITAKQTTCLCNILTEFHADPTPHQEIHHYKASSIGSVKINTSLLKWGENALSPEPRPPCKELHLSGYQGEGGILWLQPSLRQNSNPSQSRSFIRSDELTRLTSQIDGQKKRFQSVHFSYIQPNRAKLYINILLCINWGAQLVLFDKNIYMESGSLATSLLII